MLLLIDLLNRMDSGREINSLTDLTIAIAHLSGSGDLLLCKAVSFLKTTAGVISTESSRRAELVESTVGTLAVSSQVNTLEKYS